MVVIPGLRLTEIEYFLRLGSMLQFSSFIEDNCKGINRPMDLTWWDVEDGDSWNIIHLERGNLYTKDYKTLDTKQIIK
jgi:hypothetical protein